MTFNELKIYIINGEECYKAIELCKLLNIYKMKDTYNTSLFVRSCFNKQEYTKTFVDGKCGIYINKESAIKYARARGFNCNDQVDNFKVICVTKCGKNINVFYTSSLGFLFSNIRKLYDCEPILLYMSRGTMIYAQILNIIDSLFANYRTDAFLYKEECLDQVISKLEEITNYKYKENIEGC